MSRIKANILKLRIIMANACIDVRDLQEKSQMPRPTLNNVVSGRSVRPATLGKVARALGVDVREILDLEEGTK